MRACCMISNSTAIAEVTLLASAHVAAPSMYLLPANRALSQSYTVHREDHELAMRDLADRSEECLGQARPCR